MVKVDLRELWNSSQTMVKTIFFPLINQMLENEEIEVKVQALFILGHLCGLGCWLDNLTVKLDEWFF